MNLDLIKQGSVSTLKELLNIETIDMFSISFYVVANYETTSDDIDEIENIVKTKDKKLTKFISEFLEFQFNSDFIHISCFEIENTVHYKIYKKDSDLENVWSSVIKLQNIFEEIDAKDQLEELEVIKTFISRIYEATNE